MVSCNPGWIGTYYVAKDVLESSIELHFLKVTISQHCYCKDQAMTCRFLGDVYLNHSSMENTNSRTFTRHHLVLLRDIPADPHLIYQHNPWLLFSSQIHLGLTKSLSQTHGWMDTVSQCVSTWCSLRFCIVPCMASLQLYTLFNSFLIHRLLLEANALSQEIPCHVIPLL